MFGQLTSARNRGGYVVFTDYKACMCSYGISLNDRIKSWLFIVNNGMGIQITSISPQEMLILLRNGKQTNMRVTGQIQIDVRTNETNSQ